MIVKKSELICLPILWVSTVLIRAFMVILFSPLLKRTGYGITRKEMVLLVWGGLRGSLGLSLALIVIVDTNLRD
jgi:NhaP-type Na+/H+ or K+/H+ antiporter